MFKLTIAELNMSCIFVHMRYFKLGLKEEGILIIGDQTEFLQAIL